MIVAFAAVSLPNHGPLHAQDRLAGRDEVPGHDELPSQDELHSQDELRSQDVLYGLIISVDGLCGRYVAQPDQFGLKIPVIRKLLERGAHVRALTSVCPSITYPAHTTLITGCTPAEHGIAANTIFEPPTVARSGRCHW